MRKVLIEKNKKIITKEDIVEMFKKAVNTCTSYEGIYASDARIHFAVNVSGTKMSQHISFFLTKVGEIELSIGCNVSLSLNPTFSFPITSNEFRELSELLIDKKAELYEQFIKKQNLNIDTLKDYLTK